MTSDKYKVLPVPTIEMLMEGVARYSYMKDQKDSMEAMLIMHRGIKKDRKTLEGMKRMDEKDAREKLSKEIDENFASYEAFCQTQIDDMIANNVRMRTFEIEHKDECERIGF